MSTQFSMGGTAIFDYVEAIDGYTVAMTGDFNGGAYARAAGEPRVEGNKIYRDLQHFFQRQDGSTIHTQDHSVLTVVEGDERLLAETTYNVVKATGAFEGMTGQFKSWGAVDPTTGRGILRFSGVIGSAR